MALVVMLENVGHLQGFDLPAWAMNVIDFVTEEYAKLLLRVFGAYRHYDRVLILEDERATGQELSAALMHLSVTHRVDVLLLVHGHQGCLVGYRGEELVGPETFADLQQRYGKDPELLDLRMIYGLNCYGATLASTWIDLGAVVANGAIGVNWFPEPSLSIFLRSWLGGKAIQSSGLPEQSAGESILATGVAHGIGTAPSLDYQQSPDRLRQRGYYHPKLTIAYYAVFQEIESLQRPPALAWHTLASAGDADSHDLHKSDH